MEKILSAAKEVCDFMLARRWKFCLIGGLVVERWGKPRLTHDADITLLTGFGDRTMTKICGSKYEYIV